MLSHIGPANNDQSLCYEGVVRPSDSGTNAVATQGITVVIVFISTVNNDWSQIQVEVPYVPHILRSGISSVAVILQANAKIPLV